MKKSSLDKLTLASLLLGFSSLSFAGGECDACVVNAVTNVGASINANLSTINGQLGTANMTLNSIGSAINSNGSKIVNTIDQTSKSQREFEVYRDKNRKISEAKKKHEIPTNICSESGSGGAGQVINSSTSEKGSFRPGGGGQISDKEIATAINNPAPTQQIDSMRAANIHAKFCDNDDFNAYGGTTLCPNVSSMPGADKRIDTLLYGAGSDGKAPDLTFEQDQIDASAMYIQNSVRRSVGQQLKKGQAETRAGAEYLGLYLQYSSIISAASDPQEQLLADSIPNEETKKLLEEVKQSESAEKYFDLTASKYAKANGVMSTREFMNFEVGRRYANVEYQADLQSMSGENLTRELIRVNTLNAWLLLKTKEQIEKNNILTGQMLASQARQEFEPKISAKQREISGRLGGDTN